VKRRKKRGGKKMGRRRTRKVLNFPWLPAVKKTKRIDNGREGLQRVYINRREKR